MPSLPQYATDPDDVDKNGSFSGTAILVGLLPIVVLTISYSSNTTNFYNDMVDRIGAAYFFNMKVNWAVPEGDLSG